MDHYTILGVNRNSTPDEIKKAYRKLASQHHPDKGGDKVKFQQIQESYSILSDPNKKAQYDNPHTHNFQNGFSFNMNGSHVNINDIFSQIFNQDFNMGRRQQRPIYRTQITVTLQEAYTGTDKILELNTHTGKKVVTINVPKGVNSGDQMRYDNLFEHGTLLCEFVVLQDLRFERRGHDLYCNVPIDVLDLIVGTKFDFLTMSNKTLSVTVSPKTQPHMQIKLTGYGMPVMNSALYGDQYILFKPYISDNIHEEVISTILRNKGQ